MSSGKPSRAVLQSLEKRESEESFNVERFKDRLFNLSKTAGKEEKAVKAQEVPAPATEPTNILIRTIESGGTNNGSKESDESLYDQIKRKYMNEANSAESQTHQQPPYQTINHSS